MSKERPDFINVRLSDAAIKELGESGQVRFANAHAHYVFTATVGHEVLRRPEWLMLQQATLASGDPIFQEATDNAAAADHDSNFSEA